MENKYLKLAREARSENNVEDAKRYYDMARVDDPENPEAKYYSALFKLENSVNRDLPNNLSDYLACANNIVVKVKNSTLTDDEKADLLKDIVSDHISVITRVHDVIHKNSTGNTAIFNMSIYNSTVRKVVPSFETIGDQIATEFGNNASALKAAAESWKAIFRRNNWNQWYYYQSASGNKASSAIKWQNLINKIKKIDPSFVAEKPKAVQCGNK